jgi:CHAD domain-containing protein
VTLAPTPPTASAALDRHSFFPDEPLPLAVSRVSTDLLAGAVADLRPADPNQLDAGVHAARKKMKRVRGLIRLVRDEVGYSAYRNENVVLRNTARTISGVRDAWVLVEVLEGLRHRYADLLDDATFFTTQRWLLDRHETLVADSGEHVFSQAIVNLGSARLRYLAYPIADVVSDDYAGIARGVERVYRRGRNGFERSSDSRSVEDLHEWRKRVKYLRYQMEALVPLSPNLIGAAALELSTLGELLGDDHDLAVLVETVNAHPRACPDERERWLLTALAYERRDAIQAEALRIGSALYAEKPADFVARMSAYWQSGRR